jgi:ribosomal protein S18 acetylase RimI-like enzyme
LVRNFLIESFRIAPYQNWIPSRFENLRFGPCGSEYNDSRDEFIKIWESESSSERGIVAVTVLEPDREGWLLVHPLHKNVERDIIKWMEERTRALADPSESPELRIMSRSVDTERIRLLEKIGYEKGEVHGNLQERPLDLPPPEYEIPPGFQIRSVELERDFEEYRRVQASVFPHCKCMTESLVRTYASASFYNPELDLIAEAPDGQFAAFGTVRIDPVSRIAEFEPVGTHPDFRRLGLARAVVAEGIRRLRKYDPRAVCIPGAANTEAARGFYGSLGFNIVGAESIWVKDL